MSTNTKLAEALRKLEQWVSEAADEDGSSFDWHAINADEGAQARAALAAHDAEQAAQAVPAGFKLAPHYRGYALLGTGRYLIDSTDAPADPELGAELIISIASEKDREGREIGERRDMPARTIQPDDMAVRIGFANERGLFALEDQLWTLRQEHWPGTQSAAMLAAAPAAPAPEAPKAAPAGLYVGVIERLMRLSTRLGLANGDSIEHFAASLEDRLYAICRCAESLLDSLAAKPAAPAPEAQDSARTSPVHQPVHGWTDADADAARLALELECILLDPDTPMPLASRWWGSAHEALALHRQRLASEQSHGIGATTGEQR